MIGYRLTKTKMVSQYFLPVNFSFEVALACLMSKGLILTDVLIFPCFVICVITYKVSVFMHLVLLSSLPQS